MQVCVTTCMVCADVRREGWISWNWNSKCPSPMSHLFSPLVSSLSFYFYFFEVLRMEAGAFYMVDKYSITVSKGNTHKKMQLCEPAFHGWGAVRPHSPQLLCRQKAKYRSWRSKCMCISISQERMLWQSRKATTVSSLCGKWTCFWIQVHITGQLAVLSTHGASQRELENTVASGIQVRGQSL